MRRSPRATTSERRSVGCLTREDDLQGARRGRDFFLDPSKCGHADTGRPFAAPTQAGWTLTMLRKVFGTLVLALAVGLLPAAAL
jgi:hypothetical protein